MSVTAKDIYGPIPPTTRGVPVHLGGDVKGDKILICVGSTVAIRSQKDLIKTELYQEHVHNTTVARLAPSGFYCASADASGRVRIWDTVNKEHVLKGEYQMLAGAASDMAWTDDSKRIAVVGQGREKFGAVFLFDSGASVGEITGHSKTITTVDIKQTRPYRLATGSEDLAMNWFEGPPFKFKSTFREHQRLVNCVRFSPDGNKLISVGGDKKGYFFDGKTGEKIGELDAADGHTLGIYSAAWSPDNKLVLTVSADKTAKLWDAETYKCTKTFKLGNDTEDQQLGCLWNGNELLTVSLSGNINVLDIDNPEKPKKIIRGHNKLITALAYDPVARTLFSADFGGKVLQWNNETGEATEFSGAAHKNQVSAIRVNGDNLYTISMDDSIKISSISSKQWGNSVDLGVQPTGLDVAKSDGQFVVVVAGENVIVLRNGSIVSKEKLKFFANAVAVNPSATEVAIGGKDNKIHVYTVSGNSLTPKTEYAQHRGEVTALSYSHDGSLLASADSNREVLVWRNGKAEISGWVFHTTGIKSLSWSSDNDHVASVGTDGNLIVWSVSNPTVRIQQKNAHPGGINAVVFLDNNTVATAGQDSVVKTWTLKF